MDRLHFTKDSEHLVLRMLITVVMGENILNYVLSDILHFVEDSSTH